MRVMTSESISARPMSREQFKAEVWRLFYEAFAPGYQK